MRCSVRFLSVPRPLKRVQDLVAPIYSGADLLLPRERNRILDVANDAPVYKVQFGREVELNRHVVINRGQNQKFPAIFTASAQLLGANAACEVAKKICPNVQKDLAVVAPIPNLVEHREAVVVAGNRLAVPNTGS
jgi:hypothetical protein